MNNFDVFVVARSFHVFAVVIWIGGIVFVTTTLLPELKKMPNKQALFESLEGRFVLQVKALTLIAGISGYFMLEYINAWERYFQLQFWWLHLMT